MLTLNCDLGEGLDEIDALIMPYLNMANIACGGHAGDEISMARTVTLAKKHQVTIGAHPSYPDKINFGRKSMRLASDALTQNLIEQVTLLISIAKYQDISVNYIKPHGALYNDCETPEILDCLIKTSQHLKLPLMLLAGKSQFEQACQVAGIELIREAFADRRYNDDGALVPRSLAGALLNCDQSLEQTQSLNAHKKIQTVSGKWLELECETLCLHSDTQGALETAKKISLLLKPA